MEYGSLRTSGQLRLLCHPELRTQRKMVVGTSKGRKAIHLEMEKQISGE